MSEVSEEKSQGWPTSIVRNRQTPDLRISAMETALYATDVTEQAKSARIQKNFTLLVEVPQLSQSSLSRLGSSLGRLPKRSSIRSPRRDSQMAADYFKNGIARRISPYSPTRRCRQLNRNLRNWSRASRRGPMAPECIGSGTGWQCYRRGLALQWLWTTLYAS